MTITAAVVIAAVAGGTAPRNATAAEPARAVEVELAQLVDVGLVAPPADDAVLVQAVGRIRLELGAAGLQSHLLDCTRPAARETEACVEVRAKEAEEKAANGATATAPIAAAAPEPAVGTSPPAPPSAGRAPTAVLSLSRRSRAVMVEAVAILASGTKVFRLVHVPSPREGGDPELLAIRAAELLRDVRLEMARSAREEELQRQKLQQERLAEPVPEAPTPVDVVARDDASPEDREEEGFHGWAFGAGAVVLQGRNGFGAAIAPTLGAVVPLRRWWAAELAVAGPFFHTLTAPNYGSIDTRQEFAALGLRWRRDAGPVRPYLGAAVGMYHVRAAAQSDSLVPTLQVPSVTSMWAPLLAARGGAAVPLGRILWATAEVGMLFTSPAADIAIDRDVYGRTGGPSFLYQLSLLAVLP